MTIIGIDPGSTRSAFVVWHTEARAILQHAKVENPRLWASTLADNTPWIDRCVIERIHLGGRKVGNDVRDTCEWVGRFAAMWDAAHPGQPALLLTRAKVKGALGLSNFTGRAQDADVRRTLIERLREKRTSGLARDEWSALAVALAGVEELRKGAR